jgi:hypothetical protein
MKKEVYFFFFFFLVFFEILFTYLFTFVFLHCIVWYAVYSISKVYVAVMLRWRYSGSDEGGSMYLRNVGNCDYSHSFITEKTSIYSSTAV